jgi:hypothetical protein
MSAHARLRIGLSALIGVLVYAVLLSFLYGRAPYAEIPQGWRQFVSNSTAAVVLWFTAINAGGAVLAAIPVAIGLILGIKTRRKTLALVIGVLPALYILVGGFVQYGRPPGLGGWIADIAQFIAVSLAILAMVAPLESRLPGRWSKRMKSSDSKLQR